MTDASTHPAVALDDVVHQRVRLGVLALLAEIPECTFSTLRDQLHLTDGNLNRHVSVLVDAGLVSISKGYEGNRPRTWLKLTKPGRRALGDELRALQQLAQRLAKVEHLGTTT